MANKVFNFNKYEAALKELWEMKVPDIAIAKVMGLGNGIISRYRRSFNLPHVNLNSKKTVSEEDILQVFIKHKCADFSKSNLYSSDSPTALKTREACMNLAGRKLLVSDFFNPDSGEFALKTFFYCNLHAPQSYVVRYLQGVFLRYHKTPLLDSSIKGFYDNALKAWEEQNGFEFRFAKASIPGKYKVSEVFLLYVILHFAYKARNKISNPLFISKYCEFMYESGPLDYEYLVSLYNMLGVTITEDYVPSDEDFKSGRVSFEDRESPFFLYVPLMWSVNDVFTIPKKAASNYEAWLHSLGHDKVHIPSATTTEDPIITKKRVVKKPVVEAPIVEAPIVEASVTHGPVVPEFLAEDTVVEDTSDITELVSQEESSSQETSISSFDPKDVVSKAMLLDRLRDNAISLAHIGEEYLAASLLYIIHAEKHDKKYNINLKEGD